MLYFWGSQETCSYIGRLYTFSPTRYRRLNSELARAAVKVNSFALDL